MGDNDRGKDGSGSFGPYRREFEAMTQDVRDLTTALSEFKVEMAGFKGNVLGAAKGWAAGIALAGFALSIIAVLAIT